MAVKGSGGDLRSMGTSGFAILYLDKLERLIGRYRGEAHEDEMVGFYPLCAFGENRVAASIDTPLHAFLPFDHVDHLHPDWAHRAGRQRQRRAEAARSSTARTAGKIIWVPWQRPGFELALMLQRAVEANPGCDGMILGGHGLFTWGTTQNECYLNSVAHHRSDGRVRQDPRDASGAPLFGGAQGDRPRSPIARPRSSISFRRCAAPSRRTAGSSRTTTAATTRWRSRTRTGPRTCAGWAPAARITSCARASRRCSFRGIRARRTSPWSSADRRADRQVSERLRGVLQVVRRARLPRRCATANPSVVVIPGLGVFGFGKDKREARITTEFFVNAIHVMAGANALGSDDGGAAPGGGPLPQARRPEQADEFKSFQNYVALPRLEAFRIEYWALEEAKLQRMPAEREFSRRIALVVGGGSGIGREVALQIAKRGGHVVVADANTAGAEETETEAAKLSNDEMVDSAALDLTSRQTHAQRVPHDDPAVRRRRHRHQHRGDLSDAGSVGAGRRRCGPRRSTST